jgi:uncharacterized membrane protein YozB (DUF420 family)
MDLYHQPGFLGTRAFFLADLSLTLILLSAVLFTIGVALARRKQFTAHRWMQTSAAAVNAVAVLWVMLGSFFGYTLPDVPLKFANPTVRVTTAHAAVGMIGFLLGVFVVLRGNGLVPRALRFKNYKLFMRISYALYMLATLGGVMVYLVTYVL